MPQNLEKPQLAGNFRQVINIEDEHLIERRKKLFGPHENEERLNETRFGIALSGGGIRSATINLGFLKTLNKFGILKQADYLSTVSGGGYTGAYIQANLKNDGKFANLFADERIDYLRSQGEYMTPGAGWLKRWNTLLLAVGYLMSLIMSWISPVIIFGLGYIVYTMLDNAAHIGQMMSDFHEYLTNTNILTLGIAILAGLFAVHFIANAFLKYHIGLSKHFIKLESALLGIGLVWFAFFVAAQIGDAVENQGGDHFLSYKLWNYVIAAIILILAGFITNPNALSFHRFYRTQLSVAYLHKAGPYQNVKLQDLFKVKSPKEKDYAAPYPLINTCLNLMSQTDDSFKGSKASDYYLLSPLYCGAKLTGYVSTGDTTDYKDMTLPAAITISAAAVNPGMGRYSNKLLSIFMTIFNARLGFWVANPKRLSINNIVWWPLYFFYELLSRIGMDNRKLNISDGGHIENLGVYELLRRNCRLILSVDAGADPDFSFSDLENLTIRARNELGIDLHFKEYMIPEDVIRPKPSHGYSEQRFAVADILKIWEEIKPEDEQGQPILDKNGKKIEVLINYKEVRHRLDKLDNEEKAELRRSIKKMNLKDDFMYVIEALGGEDREKVKEMVANLSSDRQVRRVFSELLEMLQDINYMLSQKLNNKTNEERVKRSEVFRQVIEVIEKRMVNFLKTGTFVYVKSSVRAPEGKPQLGDRNSLAYHTYKYKIYHPSFPHEPTSDQFFDEVQWESYFQLGQFIGAEVLGDDDLETFSVEPKKEITIDKLISRFDDHLPLFRDTIQAKPVPAQVLESMATRKIAVKEEPALEPETVGEADSLEAAPGQEKEIKTAQEPIVEEKVYLGEEVQYKM